ncbi:O-methyltransferase [Spartinivicinus poritis]|uniref:Class I SAM-dependent methyltransferase n=1 Tax=Spartinivicinus poritis TaxID=2994640 RepID=A0ABT5U4A2_9GAMM|nr:class I SAM-dependent methyltransferase [Spartinivicinus sp. A2-2]MDE1461199.1 class I SAM-dependent methyltransferase [Spartinivicinus sp. A2-2]
MSRSTLNMTDVIENYIWQVGVRETAVMQQCREETAAMPNANMQIAPEQGQFLALLAQLMGAKRIVEVGTFTGYSALWMASVLPDDGELIACDISDEYTSKAKQYWQQAGITNKIDLKIKPATESLAELLAAGGAGQVDMLFIDADKIGYQDYYEQGLQLLRQGGLMAFDNTLWSGSVAEPSDDPDTVALQKFNRHVHSDQRVDMGLLPIGDGLTLVRKK